MLSATYWRKLSQYISKVSDVRDHTRIYYFFTTSHHWCGLSFAKTSISLLMALHIPTPPPDSIQTQLRRVELSAVSPCRELLASCTVYTKLLEGCHSYNCNLRPLLSLSLVCRYVTVWQIYLFTQTRIVLAAERKQPFCTFCNFCELYQQIWHTMVMANGREWMATTMECRLLREYVKWL